MVKGSFITSKYRLDKEGTANESQSRQLQKIETIAKT